MNSQVLTITTTGAAAPEMTHIPLRPQPISCKEMEDYLDRLSNIQADFAVQANQDRVSTKLSGWIKAVVVDDELDCSQLPQRDDIPANVHTVVTTHLQTLRDVVLADPLSPGKTITDPVIERTWTYEKKRLERLMEVGIKSPFDGKTMEQMRTHEFAKSVLCWADEVAGRMGLTKFLPVDAPSSESAAASAASSALVPLADRSVAIIGTAPRQSFWDNKEGTSGQLALILFLAQSSLDRDQVDSDVAAMDTQSRIWDQKFAASRERLERDRIKARESSEAHEKETGLLVENQKAVYRAADQANAAMVATLQTERQESEAKATADRVQAQQTLDVLQHAQELAAQVAAEAREQSEADRKATEERLTTLEQQTNARIDEMEQAHEATSTVLEQRVADAEKTQNELATQLQTAATTCNAQAQRIGVLETAVAQQAQQIQNAQPQGGKRRKWWKI